MLAIQKHKCAALYSAILGLGLFFGASQPAAALELDHSSAVIFVYQRIADDSVPQGSISLDQFKEHIKELKTGGYNVMPLPNIIDALKNGDQLPVRTVGLTFDGGYSGTMNVAQPLLDDAELPFTVFFSSDMAEQGGQYMTWKQLKSLKKDKLASLGILPSA